MGAVSPVLPRHTDPTKMDPFEYEYDDDGPGFSRRKPSVDVKEQIVHAVGGFGPWQMRKALFISAVIWVPASFHLLNMIFFR